MVLEGPPSLVRSPSLKDAEDSRLMARIERNFECLRRDGRAAGTLSGWGDLLLKKFKNTEAEKSEMAPSQSSILSAWLNGAITGRVAMIEFLQGEQRVRQHVDPCSITASYGLGSILDSEWLFMNVFSRPPQAVIYETLLLCAEDALEKKPENLTASQINLALRKLALAYLPRSGENASDAALSESETAALAAKEHLAAGIPRQSDGGTSLGAPAPGDHYLRIAVAMELLRLHIVEGQSSDASGGGKLKKSKSRSSMKTQQEETPHGDEVIHSLEALGEMCIEGLGVDDVETIIIRELENIEKVAAGGDSASTAKLDDDVAEKLNRFLEAYVNSVNKVKARLLHQVRWLDEKGAYFLLGVDADASESTIKKRYHRLSLKAHPDKGGDAETFQKLKMAYEAVIRKKKRAAARLEAVNRRAEEAKVEAARAKADARKVAHAAAKAKAETARKNAAKKTAAVSASTAAANASLSRKQRSPPAPDSGRKASREKAESTKRAQMAKYGQRRANPFASPTPETSEQAESGIDSPQSAEDWGMQPLSKDNEGGGGASKRSNSPDDDWDLQLSDDENEGVIEGNASQHQNKVDKVDSFDMGDDDDDFLASNDDAYDDCVEANTTFEDGEGFQSFENTDVDSEDEGLWPTGDLSPPSHVIPEEEEEEEEEEERGRRDKFNQTHKAFGSDDENEASESKPVFGCEFGTDFGPAFGTPVKSLNSNNREEDLEEEEEGEEIIYGLDGKNRDADSDIDEDEEDDPTAPPNPVMTPVEHLKKLSELEKIAKSAAKRAASLAHICIQWSKVVEEVRALSRPRGVDHLSSLIKKGAFSSAVDVMEPTQEAASAVMDIVGSAIEVTKESPQTMSLASTMGFFKSADRVTSEGRAALSSASAASEVNAAAVKAMGKLGSLGDLARQDDEVHSALVDMLCLHFQRVADSTQQCAKQALVAVTAASHVCSLVDLIHAQAKLEAESLDDASDEEGGEDDGEEARKAQQEAEEVAAKKSKAKDSNGEDGKENQTPDENDKQEDGEDETVDSLMGKLRDLHAQMRLRHAVNLKKANTEVLCLQTRIANSIQEYSLQDFGLMISPPKIENENENSSSKSSNRSSMGSVVSTNSPWRPLLLTLADLVNSSCLEIEDSFKDMRKNARSIDSNWWKSSLAKHIGWMNTLNTRNEVAIATTSRGKVLRLAASRDSQAVMKILTEMSTRLKLFASTDDMSCIIDSHLDTLKNSVSGQNKLLA